MKKPLTLSRAKTAALFIDLQEEHRHDPRYLVEGYDRVLTNVGKLQAESRGNDVPVLHCAYVVDTATMRPFHPVNPDGTSAFSDKSDPLTDVCPEVAPQGDELLLIKGEASAFGDGRLAPLLRGQGIEWLIVAGVWTEACVDATVKHAVTQGFHVLLVKDACGSGTDAMHRTGILNLASRLYGGAVVDTAGALRLIAGETVDAWQVEGSVPVKYRFDNASEFYDAL
ncbi:MAG: isochorismatase family protein [Rhizobiaceae bacterium]